jgi:hypothetical protein
MEDITDVKKYTKHLKEYFDTVRPSLLSAIQSAAPMA